MARIYNWIDHLNKPTEDVIGSVYPGQEFTAIYGILVFILFTFMLTLICVSEQRKLSRFKNIPKNHRPESDI